MDTFEKHKREDIREGEWLPSGAIAPMGNNDNDLLAIPNNSNNSLVGLT